MNSEETIHTWPLETEDDRKHFGVLKGIELHGSSTAQDPQYLVASFKNLSHKIVRYKVEGRSAVRVLRHAMNEILSRFEQDGSVCGPDMTLQRKRGGEIVDLFNKEFNQP